MDQSQEKYPETKNVKFINWRYAPGYRDIDLLVEVDGIEVWLHFNKVDARNVRNIIDQVIRDAGNNPIDKD